MQIFIQPDNLRNHKQYLKIKNWVREFLDKAGYVEVDLPVLTPALIPEAHLGSFSTRFRYFEQEQNLYLITSAELFSKRLLTEGLGSSYNITRCFRNGDVPTSRHHFEFTMLEYYRVGGNYMSVADETLQLLQFLIKKLYDSSEFNYQGKIINLAEWEKISVEEAFLKYANIKNVLDEQAFIEQAAQQGYKTEGFSYADIWSQIYTQAVEPNLGCHSKPTLIYNYPVSMSGTAKRTQNYAERFEFYINGVELGNCYSELSDYQEQAQRLAAERKILDQAGREYDYDEEFLQALQRGLPTCSGMAMGLERLATVLLNLDDIRKLQLISIS